MFFHIRENMCAQKTNICYLRKLVCGKINARENKCVRKLIPLRYHISSSICISMLYGVIGDAHPQYVCCCMPFLSPDYLPQGPLPSTIQGFLHHSFQLDHCCIEEHNAEGDKAIGR